MPYSSSIGASGGAKRSGRWFVLVFLCMALILALVPAVSLGWGVQAKVTLTTSKGCVDYGGSVKLIARATSCPSHAVFTLQAKGSSGIWATVASAPAKNGMATFKAMPTRNTCYRTVLTYSGGTKTSNTVTVCVRPRLTVCAKPGQYAGGIVINGTLNPGETGGKVTITIAKQAHCGHMQVVATLTATLVQGSGDSSTYCTSWAGGSASTRYFITASVPKTADLAGACAMTQIKL